MAARLTSFSIETEQPMAVLELGDQPRRVPARQVRRVPQPAGRRVERAADADDHLAADALGEPGQLDRLADALADPRDGLGRGPALGGQLVLGQGPAGDVGDRDADPGGRHVDARHVARGRIHLVQLRIGAGAARRGADRDDQPGGFEAAEQLGGGRLGKPGERADLGPRERPVGEQQLERRAIVDGAQQARRACEGLSRGHVTPLRSPHGGELLGKFPITVRRDCMSGSPACQSPATRRIPKGHVRQRFS